MDREQRAVMSMHIRRLGDGDKAQYLQHFKESRDITVGEYQEYMDDSERKLDILRNLPGITISGMDAGIPAGLSAGVSAEEWGLCTRMGIASPGSPSMLPTLLGAAVSPLVVPITAAAAEVNDHMKTLEKELHKQMGLPDSAVSWGNTYKGVTSDEKR